MGSVTGRSTLSIWRQTLGAHPFPASAVPVVVGPALALDHGGTPSGGVAGGALCPVLFLGGTNVINYYFDYARGVDHKTHAAASAAF